MQNLNQFEIVEQSE